MNAKTTLLAVAALGCGLLGLTSFSGPAPAGAAPSGVTLTFSCTFPFLVDKQDLSVQITTNLPKVAVVDKGTVPQLTITTEASVNDTTARALKAVDGATIEGYAKAGAIVERPGIPEGLSVGPYAGIKKTPIPPGGSFKITADALSPGLSFANPGRGRIVLRDELTLYPLVKKADGSLTGLGKDLKVGCTRKSGSNVIAEFTVARSDDQPPSRPGTPAVTDQTGRTVSLKWRGSDDNLGVGGYRISSGGSTLLDTYGSETSAIVPVKPNTTYDLTVQARDPGENLSEPSDAVPVRTGADVPERKPPTTPGRPVVMKPVGGSWVRMKWEPSTDNLGVTAYEIHKDGKLAASFPATQSDGWVENLEARNTYLFTVRARDAAGNVSAFSPPVSATTGRGSPAGCGTYPGAPRKLSSRGCVFMAGYTNVKKLKGATVINDPAEKQVYANVAYTIDKDENTLDARFKFNGPLRSKATFLTFGFMPTSATMELTQVGHGTMHGDYVEGKGYKLTAETKVAVRIYDASVNGSALNLGPFCQTPDKRPMTLKLTATPENFKDILEGGVLTGYGTIPGFKGCGFSEDIDRLFIGAISGAGNYVKIRQGPLCKPDSARCGPVAPQR